MVELYNMDCLEGMKNIPDESIDCVVTDPPYHICSGGVSTGKFKLATGILSRTSGDNIKYVKKGTLFEFNDIKFSEWLPEVYRVLKPDTHCYIMINARNMKELLNCAEDVGFKLQNILVWMKDNRTPNRYYMNQAEFILLFRKGGAKTINIPGTSNIIQCGNLRNKQAHPTEKPVELMRVFIENSTNRRERVLDPFMGVGATGVACKMLDRDFIGYELSEQYYAVAVNRCNEQSTQVNDKGRLFE